LPTFRDEISRIQKNIATLDEDDVLYEAEEIGRRWKLNERYWLAWLIKTWHPDDSKYPPQEPHEQMPFLAPWTLTIESLSDGENTIDPFRTQLTFYPGISATEGTRAVKLATQLLSKIRRPRAARPKLSEVDQAALTTAFAAIGHVPAGGRRPHLRKLQEALAAGGRLFSRSLIEDQYRKYLASLGIPSRTYTTRQTDRR
jgi:hypothetical protein